jgi:hypothetical protein
MTRVGEFEFPCNGAKRSVSDAETFSMFSDLMFLAKEFVSTAQTALGTPTTVVFFGYKLALVCEKGRRCEDYPRFPIPTIQTFECSACSESVVSRRTPSGSIVNDGLWRTILRRH